MLANMMRGFIRTPIYPISSVFSPELDPFHVLLKPIREHMGGSQN